MPVRAEALLGEREMREAGEVRGVLEQTAAVMAAKSLSGNVDSLRAECDALMRTAAAPCSRPEVGF